ELILDVLRLLLERLAVTRRDRRRLRDVGIVTGRRGGAGRLACGGCRCGHFEQPDGHARAGEKPGHTIVARVMGWNRLPAESDDALVQPIQAACGRLLPVPLRRSVVLAQSTIRDVLVL